MDPTTSLNRLLGATCVGTIAIVLVAQMFPATSAPPLAAKSDPITDPAFCGSLPGALAGEGPLAAIDGHLCGFHFYSGDVKRAVRAEHFCSHFSKDVFQCVIYDSNAKDARLVGIEYIISEALFNQLPAAEKKLWHSHRYEVMSGQLVAPGLAGAAEKVLMMEFIHTYGKTWYLWQSDRGDKLPIGLPKLMMGFTGDGQADPKMVADRDRELHIDSAKIRAQRASFPARPVASGADGWQQGPAFQLADELLTAPPPAPLSR